MKTRTSTLLCALSFLVISVASGSAYMIPCPCDLQFSLNSSSVTFDLTQQEITPDTVRGTLTNVTPDNGDAVTNYTLQIQSAPQWVTFVRINGIAVQAGDTITIAPGQTFPVEVIIFPYAERPDTENYCLSIMYGSKTVVQQCIPLVVTNAKSAVSTDLPASNITLVPNPAASSLFVQGLDKTQTGYRFEIFSLSGAEVLHGILPADARIDVQDLSSGAYRLLLSDAKGILFTTAMTVLH